MTKNMTKCISDWYKLNKRDLPWRTTKDPYIIWVSEIILHQTRINQGTPYYFLFLENFPDIHSLASSSEDKVLKIWQGLGYYSRARNMHITAIKIVEKYGGKFPETYNELIRLEGIGEYTASLLLSVCFNKPYPVLDGNVYRILSRLFASSKLIDSSIGKSFYKQQASKLLDKENPGDFNEALMDLGAMVCLPDNPLCNLCPVKNYCIAFEKNEVHLYPQKSRKNELEARYLHYFLIRDKNNIVLKKRTQDDIWKNLYDLPLIENDSIKKLNWIKFSQQFNYKIIAFKFLHQKIYFITHQKLMINFYLVEIDIIDNLEKDLILVSLDSIDKYALPKPIEVFLKNPTLIHQQ